MVDERVMTWEARKWIGLDPVAPLHLPLGGSGTWRPLTVYSWWLDAGLPVPLRHALHLALHGGLVALVHAWLRGRFHPAAAALAACWFAVHPAHVANVGWLGGRPDLLMAVAAAGALLAWDRERWVLASVLAAAAVLFKETGVAVLPMLALTRADRRLAGPAVGVGLAFGLTLLRAMPEPGYAPSADAIGAAAPLLPPFLVELVAPWFVPIGVPSVARDLVGIALAVPVMAAFVLVGAGSQAWHRGVALALVALLPVLHVLPNDGGAWYLLLPSVGLAMAWAEIAQEARWRRGLIAMVALTAILATTEAFAWRAAG